MNISLPQNAKVLHYLSRGRLGSPAFARREDAQTDPYYGCGSHPDIVARIWDEIGAVLPVDCRCLVHGTPALVHPRVGVILAIAIGTQYGLRLPGGLLGVATKAGARTHTKWAGGREMDTQQDLGEDWVFGGWLQDELNWCKSVYEMLDPGA